MTTVAYTRGPNVITLTVPRAACETGSDSYTPHPIVQYPSSWDGDHRTDVTNSMARPTAGLPGNSHPETPTKPSQSSGPPLQGPSKLHDAPGATPTIVSEALQIPAPIRDHDNCDSGTVYVLRHTVSGRSHMFMLRDFNIFSLHVPVPVYLN
jgi:hypothetical protein